YPSQQVKGFHIIDTLLFAFGLFQTANFEIPVKWVAAWNGKKWCGYDFDFQSITSITSNDSILFLGGWNIYEGEALIGIKNFRNFDFCTTPLGLSTKTKINLNAGFQVFPNPANNQITLNSEGLN